jgi:hypothetical protein
VNFDQPKELADQMRLSEGLINSEVSLDQHVQLMEEEDQDNIMMIGGIQIFLLFCPGGGRSLCCRWCSNNRRIVN